jgi:hypothetical protein
MPPKDKILNLARSVGFDIIEHLHWLHLMTIVEGFLAVGVASALKE